MSAFLACEYVPSTASKPSEYKRQIAQLKDKITDLEGRISLMASDGSPESTGVAAGASYSSHSRDKGETTLTGALRDLALNASGYSYIGGTANITLARLLEPVLQDTGYGGQAEARLPSGCSDVGEPANDPLVTRNFPRVEATDSDVSSLSDPTVEVVFQAYVRFVSTEYPVIHLQRLREMHARRLEPESLHEVCILRLVYAIGGITLQLVSSKSFLELPIIPLIQYQGRRHRRLQGQ